MLPANPNIDLGKQFETNAQHASLVYSAHALCVFVNDVGALSANMVPRLDSPALHAPGALLPPSPSPRVSAPAATPAPHKRKDSPRVRNEMRFHPLRRGVVLLALVCILTISWIKSIPGDGGKVICLFIYLSFFICSLLRKKWFLKPCASLKHHTHTHIH